MNIIKMGALLSGGKKKDKKQQEAPKGVVKHREAAQNRVDETDMQIAELKSRMNKLRPYR